MGLDEIEQRCNDYGVSITLTPQEHNFGKDIRNLELLIKEFIIKTNGISGDGSEYLELYELQEKVASLIRKYNRYTNDKVDLDDDDLRIVLEEEFREFQMEYSRIKPIVDKYEKKLNKSDDGLTNSEWESFLVERSKQKVANVIITNRSFDSFQKYFLETSGSKDLSLQAIEGLIDTLKKLENTANLSMDPASGKMKGSGEDVMEYRFTSSENGGVFRAIYFYDKIYNHTRLVHDLLFKSEPEAANNSRIAADNFIKQSHPKNHYRTNNELIEIHKNLSQGNIEEYEKRILFMYKELFRLKKEFQNEEKLDIRLDDDEYNSSKAI